MFKFHRSWIASLPSLSLSVGTSLLLLCGTAGAGTVVNWETGGVYVQDLGKNGAPNADPLVDWVNLTGATGTLDLVAGSPQIVQINPLAFGIGQTGDQPDESYSLTTDFNLSQNLTINGITQSLVSPATHVVTWFADSLQLHEGAPLVFGNIQVTPLGWNTAFSDGVGEFNQTSPSWHTISPVYAEFTLVPEPASLGLLGLGMVGLLIRRRKA